MDRRSNCKSRHDRRVYDPGFMNNLLADPYGERGDVGSVADALGAVSLRNLGTPSVEGGDVGSVVDALGAVSLRNLGTPSVEGGDGSDVAKVFLQAVSLGRSPNNNKKPVGAIKKGNSASERKRSS